MTIAAAGGTLERRVLYRASSMQVLGSVVNGHLGVAARIGALRRAHRRAIAPRSPTLIAAEFPILAVEGMLAALASFTLVGPLGLPWWAPLVGFLVVGALSVGLRRLALQKGLELWRGLAVLHNLAGGRRVVGFVLVAVFAQILRNWLLLRGVGVDASLFDADGGADRAGRARAAARRADRRRCRRGADPRERRSGRGRRGRPAADGHRHARRTLLRRLGRRRPPRQSTWPGVRELPLLRPRPARVSCPKSNPAAGSRASPPTMSEGRSSEEHSRQARVGAAVVGALTVGAVAVARPATTSASRSPATGGPGALDAGDGRVPRLRQPVRRGDPLPAHLRGPRVGGDPVPHPLRERHQQRRRSSRSCARTSATRRPARHRPPVPPDGGTVTGSLRPGGRGPGSCGQGIAAGEFGELVDAIRPAPRT